MIQIKFDIKKAKFDWMDWLVNCTLRAWQIEQREIVFSQLIQKGNQAILEIGFGDIEYSINYQSYLAQTFLKAFEENKREAVHQFLCELVFSIKPIHLLIK